MTAAPPDIDPVAYHRTANAVGSAVGALLIAHLQDMTDGNGAPYFQGALAGVINIAVQCDMSPDHIRDLFAQAIENTLPQALMVRGVRHAGGRA